MYTVHADATHGTPALSQEVGGAADDGASTILDQDLVGQEVLPAVGSAHVEGPAVPLDVETIQQENRRHDFSIQLL